MARVGDFSFPDFSSFQHAPADVNGYALAPAAHVNAHGLPQLQTAQHAPLYPAPTDGNISPANGMASPHSAVDNKRKADAMLEHSPSSHGMNYEDASRLAAEEDKRRRNTAASARFRVKKKQREQALEKSAKEMSDKVAALESRINQLETENKWLKNLVMEKNNKEGEGKEDLAALWKKFSQENAAVKTTGVKAETKA